MGSTPELEKIVNKLNWNTYAITAHTIDVANDQRSAGGLHLHQIRMTRAGKYQCRILQTNGRHRASGPIKYIDADKGEAFIYQAELY